jgi:hypothetical protein
MDKPPNHACFEAAMADLLDQLYRAFPAPLGFDFAASFEAAKLRGLMPGHCQASFTHYASLYGSTLGFLEREGVIHAKRLDDFKAAGVVLTSKGFLLLNRPLESFAGEPVPTGQRFGEIGKAAGTEAMSAVIGQTVAHFFAALTA